LTISAFFLQNLPKKSQLRSNPEFRHSGQIP
jgi:hypothetical protein